MFKEKKTLEACLIISYELNRYFHNVLRIVGKQKVVLK